MAQRKNVLFLFAALVALQLFRSRVFVPAPLQKSSLSMQSSTAAACAAALFGAAGNAHADAIGDAAAKVSKAAYPFMKEVNWNSNLYNINPGSADAVSWAKAIGKMIDMGAQMDTKLLKAGADAHHAAMSGLPASGVCSEAQLTGIIAAIGRMIASVPESQVMDVYNSISALVSPDVGPFLMSTVKEADAKAAYQALLEFKDVVKANPITPAVTDTPAALSSKLGPIDAAAAKLSAASYPFIKDIDWTSDLYLKPLPGVTPNQAMKGPIDKMLVMGASMDGNLLKKAAEAHHKALGSMDAKLVTTLDDYTAINGALGKAIASVPSSQVMDVYNSVAKILNPVIANNLYSGVVPNDAQAAYTAFLNFKDIVKAAQR